ncbi:MAG: alpha/beta hydrolase [Candidatus Tumulicola sp.]
MESERGRIDVGGRALEWLRIPAREKNLPVLVFLHEGLGSLALWRGFPAALAERTGCEALVFSRYGNGFSTPLTEPRKPEYMHDEALAALPELLDALEIHDFILVGHSDGASIALIYAAEHPERVRGLVLEAPHVFVEDLSVRSIAALASEYRSSSLRQRMARHHSDADATFYGWSDIWLASEFRDWNIEAYVERVVSPILVIQGLNDEYGTPAQIESIVRHAAAPVDRIVLANCGHAPHRDRASFVENVAAAWIRSSG